MAFNFDQVKNLFSSLREKSSEYASAAADKTKDAARIAKLSMEMNSEKDNLKKAYLELGKAFYEENKGKAEGLFVQLCEEIDSVNERISGMQAEIDGLKASFKPAKEADFEEVVAEAEEPDISVEVVEEPCEACEAATCDGCDIAKAAEDAAEEIAEKVSDAVEEVKDAVEEVVEEIKDAE